MVNWEEGRLAKLRQCQLDLVKSLGANTNAEVWKKRTTTPSKDFSITFLPSNPGPGVMDLVGTIDFKELERIKQHEHLKQFLGP